MAVNFNDLEQQTTFNSLLETVSLTTIKSVKKTLKKKQIYAMFNYSDFLSIPNWLTRLFEIHEQSFDRNNHFIHFSEGCLLTWRKRMQFWCCISWEWKYWVTFVIKQVLSKRMKKKRRNWVIWMTRGSKNSDKDDNVTVLGEKDMVRFPCLN